MKKNWIKQYIISLAILLTIIEPIHARSCRRPADLTIPVISVRPSDPVIAETWFSRKTKDNVRFKIKHELRSSYLRIHPISKAFNPDFFKEFYLPKDEHLQFRNAKGTVHTSTLNKLAQELVAEIKAGQKEFTHFKILKDKDFNYNKLSGLLVLKYKSYPFVIKLAIEHPHTMVDPYSRSAEATFIFILGGNIRHLSNFTRISNLENIKKILMYNPYYLENIDFPRKWYWQPDNNYNLEITWHASPYKSEEKFSIPSIYAVISDYIDIDPTFPQQELNKIAMKISTDTEFLIDPHAGNTVVEKGSTKYTMLDTENFRIMTGLDCTMNAQKYLSWYLEMATSCLKVYSGRTKQERIKHCFFCAE